MTKILTSGAFVNFLLVIAGSFVGLLLKKGIPDRVQKTVMAAMALSVIYIGVIGILEDGINTLMIIISLGIGGTIGELLDLDGVINRLGQKIEDRFKKSGGQNTKIAEGFVSATLLFCVGAMTIVGSIDSGVSGDNATLYSKSVIDCVAAAVFSASLGFGVMLSAFAVLAIEGTLTLLAVAVQPILTAEVISHMSVIGSLLIIAIAFNMLKITKIKVMNIMPAVFIPMVMCLF